MTSPLPDRECETKTYDHGFEGTMGESLHDQVRRDLLARIMGGEYQPGDMLPNEDTLCKHYGVSRITIRRAITDLATQFVITRRRGIGTVVRYNGLGKRFFRLSGFFEDRSLLEYRIISEKFVPAEQKVADTLRLDRGTKVNHRQFVTHRGDDAFTLANLYSPVKDKSTTLGARIDKATQELHAVVADDWTARQLGIEPGAPLLGAERTYFDDQGEPVRYLIARYHPEHYRFIVDLQASHGRPVFEGELA